MKGLLDRGRERLRFRLMRRGVALSAAGVATMLGETGWAATVSPVLAVPTVQAAMKLVSGKTLAECGVSASVVTLVKGGLSMYPKKMLLVLMLLLLGVGAVLWAANSGADPEGRPEQRVLAQNKADKGKEQKKDEGDSAEEEAVIDRFIGILKDPKSPERLAACTALGKRGTKAKRALPEMMGYLKEKLEDKEKKFENMGLVRWFILPATISIGGNGQETFDLLANTLKSKESGFERDAQIACLARFAVACNNGLRSKVRVELQVIAETQLGSADMARRALVVAKDQCLGEIDYNLFRDDRKGKSLKLPDGAAKKVEMLDGFDLGLMCQIDKENAVRVGWSGGQFPRPGMHIMIVTGADNKTGYIKVDVSHDEKK